MENVKAGGVIFYFPVHQKDMIPVHNTKKKCVLQSAKPPKKGKKKRACAARQESRIKKTPCIHSPASSQGDKQFRVQEQTSVAPMFLGISSCGSISYSRLAVKVNKITLSVYHLMKF